MRADAHVHIHAHTHTQPGGEIVTFILCSFTKEGTIITVYFSKSLSAREQVMKLETGAAYPLSFSTAGPPSKPVWGSLLPWVHKA